MNADRREGKEDVDVVINPERLLCNGCRFAVPSIAAISVVNPRIAPQSLHAALKEVATPVSSPESESTFKGLADMLVWEDRSALRTPPTHCA